VNLPRLISNVKINYKHLPAEKSRLNPAYVIQRVDEVIKNLIVIPGEDVISREA
jgi:hypothetical protein